MFETLIAIGLAYLLYKFAINQADKNQPKKSKPKTKPRKKTTPKVKVSEGWDDTDSDTSSAINAKLPIIRLAAKIAFADGKLERKELLIIQVKQK